MNLRNSESINLFLDCKFPCLTITSFNEGIIYNLCPPAPQAATKSEGI